MSYRIYMFVLATGLFACGSGSDAVVVDPVVDPGIFVYATSQDVDFDLTFVDEDGVPVPGVSVQVMSSVTPPGMQQEGQPLGAGELFYLGASGAEGRFRGTASIPTVYETLDVVAHKPGWGGEYTYPELELIWGPFAPSARIQFDRADALDHVIALEENE